MQFILTFPVGSAKFERSISALRRVSNYSRTIARIEHLSNLLFLTIESSLLDFMMMISYPLLIRLSPEGYFLIELNPNLINLKLNFYKILSRFTGLPRS